MEKLFDLCTLKEVLNDFNPPLVSIENDDYRGCDPAPPDKIKLWYRGSDVFKTEVTKIVVDGNIWRCWLK